MRFKKIIVCFSCVAGLSFSSFAYSYDAAPRCYLDLELTFFQGSVVSQALSLRGINQSVWTPIVMQLQNASKSVHDIIRSKAVKMRPNPFTPVFIPELARELLLSTLFQIFIDVMTPYQSFPELRISNSDIQDMFNFILNQQQEKVARCLGVPAKKG